ncbi:MAG: hypothetical protein DRO67_08070 [Candidatus Asgardarchaeum californiense]|nr:MAG: hypothetical protein DRO67_08070 [Candidatus Asgardarchaeum californiense]
MVKYCSKCGRQHADDASFCPYCGNDVRQQSSITPSNPPISRPPPSMQSAAGTSLWNQNFYRIRKKVLAVGNKYWIEDANSKLLGFCKQKILKLKEDIRIYTDENMNDELFRIQQEQIMDAWGSFAIIDSKTGTKLGSIKREWASSAFYKDKYEVYDTNNTLIGKIEETSGGRALARKFMPGGALVPEEMHLELNGQKVATINQEFKIVGDIWNMNCINVPPDFDRRVLLSCILLMGTIERSRK